MVWYGLKIFVKEIVNIVIVEPVALLVRVLRFQVRQLKTVNLPLQVLDNNNNVIKSSQSLQFFLFIGLCTYLRHNFLLSGLSIQRSQPGTPRMKDIYHPTNYLGLSKQLARLDSGAGLLNQHLHPVGHALQQVLQGDDALLAIEVDYLSNSMRNKDKNLLTMFPCWTCGQSQTVSQVRYIRVSEGGLGRAQRGEG